MMLRKHASLVIAIFLIALVTTACLVTTRPAPRGQVVQPVQGKQKKHKDPDDHDNGHGHDKHKH